MSINFDSGRPRSPFNTDADKCLTSLAPDEIGGAGLGYGHCSHYGKTDNRGRPRTSIEKPTNETLFYFFADGRVRNVRTGWCIRRTKCHGHYVYDLGGCDSPLVSKFNLWQALRLRTSWILLLIFDWVAKYLYTCKINAFMGFVRKKSYCVCVPPTKSLPVGWEEG